uniref:ATP synthase subunit a n=1 Tax=Plotocnide borealis TaxID=1755686 RepID=A0A0S2IBB6_9CNID|nr:ATP synthase F0 subunit 6 [Plotocnide borealis]
MASYFDHFIIIKFINYIISDSLLIFLCVFILYMFLFKSFNIIPGRFQIITEKIISHWEVVIEENLGGAYYFYILPILCLFIFILGLNLLGFFLWTLPPTTHISLTFGFAVSIWLGVMILGIIKFKENFFSSFMPSGAPIMMSPLLIPIEFASHLSRPIALGMRLAANLTAGHILLAILADFSSKMLFFSSSMINLFPLLIIIFMTILEIGVLIIQAYVYCLLVMIYLRDSLILH